MNEIFLPEDIDRAEVYKLLERAVYEYTGAGSSSVPIETATELLKGICRHIRVGATGYDAYSRCEAGRETAIRKAHRALGRYNWLISSAQDYGNITLRDTLKGLGVFFKSYNPRLFPHETPGDIDYQLAHPLDEELDGADYILEYIRRLSVEERFCAHYATSEVKSLLALYSPECDALAINVYDMVFTNAVGKALSGCADDRLVMTRTERERAIDALYLRPIDYIAREVGNAAKAVLNGFAVKSAEMDAYTALSCGSLSSRLYQSLGYSPERETCELFLFK